MPRIKLLNSLLLLSVLLTLACASPTNTTAETDDDDDDYDDEDLDMDFETFKSTIKRYRRLIPYMSNYVANNHVNNQAESPIYDGNEALSPQPLILRPGRLKPQRITTLVKQEKFIPSVQYDPKKIGGDNEYFTPVRYNTKPAQIYDDYYRDYDRRTIYPEIMTTVKIPENRYYNTKERLLPRPQKTFIPQKHQQIPNIYQDYFLDYMQRPKPAVQNQEYYPVEGIEDYKYVKIEPPRYQQNRLQLRRPSYSQSKTALISDENLIRSLQLTNQLPEMLSRDNLDASIKTLVEILSLLQSKKPENTPVHLSEPVVSQNIPSYDEPQQHYSRPNIVTETRYQATPAPLSYKNTRYQNNNGIKINSYADYGVKNHEHIEYYQPVVQDIDEHGNVHDYEARPPYKVENNAGGDYERPYKINEKPYKAPGNYEISENVDEGVDDKQQVETTTEPPKHFQLAEGFLSDALNIPTMAIKYGATRGKPNIDYPAYAAIPETDFSCKEQRYKGFFGDPSTGCQVWHYCDLNGGKSSFLCPNGTIFSQAALTCDWWFNVKCESTKQLYVLNERLYKFILPIMPKFPEDFSGPEVDRYLEMKFKEMEAKMKAKKLKKAMEKKKIEKTTTVSSIE